MTQSIIPAVFLARPFAAVLELSRRKDADIALRKPFLDLYYNAAVCNSELDGDKKRTATQDRTTLLACLNKHTVLWAFLGAWRMLA